MFLFFESLTNENFLIYLLHNPCFICGFKKKQIEFYVNEFLDVFLMMMIIFKNIYG